MCRAHSQTPRRVSTPTRAFGDALAVGPRWRPSPWPPELDQLGLSRDEWSGRIWQTALGSTSIQPPGVRLQFAADHKIIGKPDQKHTSLHARLNFAHEPLRPAR